MTDDHSAVVQPSLPVGQSRWPLAWIVWFDLLIVVLLVLLLNVAFGAWLVAQAAEQGVNLRGSDGSVNAEAFTRLIGPLGFVGMALGQCVIFSLVPMLRVGLLRRTPLAQIGFQVQQPLQLLAMGLWVGVAMFMLNVATAALFASLGIVQNQSAQFPLFAGDWAGQVLIALAAVVAAPLGEEILFRGYVFNALRERWGALLALLVSALLFSLAHSLSATQGLIALLVPAFLIGLALGWCMQRSGSLLPCIIAHAFNNSVAISLAIMCANNPGMCRA